VAVPNPKGVAVPFWGVPVPIADVFGVKIPKLE